MAVGENIKLNTHVPVLEALSFSLTHYDVIKSSCRSHSLGVAVPNLRGKMFFRGG